MKAETLAASRRSLPTVCTWCVDAAVAHTAERDAVIDRGHVVVAIERRIEVDAELLVPAHGATARLTGVVVELQSRLLQTLPVRATAAMRTGLRSTSCVVTRCSSTSVLSGTVGRAVCLGSRVHTAACRTDPGHNEGHPDIGP